MSVSNMTIIKAFNKTLLKFIEELELKYPEETDISVYKNSILLLDKTNAKLVPYYYKIYVNNLSKNNKKNYLKLKNPYTIGGKG